MTQESTDPKPKQPITLCQSCRYAAECVIRQCRPDPTEQCTAYYEAKRGD